MSKKKNIQKKHKFKHTDPEYVVKSEAQTASRSSGVTTNTPIAPVSSGRDFSYVGRDVRRIGYMVGGLILIELAFYYALVFTAIGPAIYRLVNV